MLGLLENVKKKIDDTIGTDMEKFLATLVCAAFYSQAEDDEPITIGVLPRKVGDEHSIALVVTLFKEDKRQTGSIFESIKSAHVRFKGGWVTVDYLDENGNVIESHSQSYEKMLKETFS